MLSVGTASACSCEPVTQPTEFAWSELVFRGLVTSIDELDTGYNLVSLRVATMYKGSSTETTVIETWWDTAGCGYPFRTGFEYLVYSHDGSSTYLCGLTTAVDDMSPSDFVVLGKGYPPTPDVPALTTQAVESAVAPEEDMDQPDSSQERHNYWITGAAIAAAITFTGLLMRLPALRGERAS